MALTDNAALFYEAGQTEQVFEAMTDSGDQKTFESSFAPWSGRSGFTAAVRPYGVVTGFTITPDTGSNDTFDVAAGTAHMPGEAGASPDSDGLVTVAASAGETITRPATNDYQIFSVTVDTNGAIAVVDGAEGTSFSETRGANGGPPLIPTTSIEVGQIRVNSQTAAVIQASEIKQVVGSHQERWDFPVWSENEADGEITFVSALPAIHTGPVPKKVYVKGFTPIFAEQPRCSDWVPAETTHTVNSTPVYDGAVGSVTPSLGQASFTSRLNDGITDNILNQKNQRIWVKFFQDRNKAPYQLTLGTLGVGRTFPVGELVTTNFTLSAEMGSADRAS